MTSVRLIPTAMFLAGLLALSACGREEAAPAAPATPPAVPVVAPAAPAAPQATATAETRWESLVPPNWDPEALFKGVDLDKFEDNDPRARELMRKLRRAWDEAPVNPAMDGQAIRIPGYVVPLDQQPDGIREFLLVPYFGACVHVPPPPANQIIHVLLEKPMDLQTMSAVWVSGTLETMRAETEMGKAGYRVRNPRVQPYEAP